jgi:hypothetical protein
MPSLDWLTARPIAHRDLHAAQNGVRTAHAPAVVAYWVKDLPADPGDRAQALWPAAADLDGAQRR